MSAAFCLAWIFWLLLGASAVASPLDENAGTDIASRQERASARGVAKDLANRLQLPASFQGILPGAGNIEADAQLDLWPDGVFHLQSRSQTTGSAEDDRGRWRFDANDRTLRLHGGRRDQALILEIVDPRTLKLDDPASSSYLLKRKDPFAPAAIKLGLHGMFNDLADAARFKECLTGREYPVAMEGDFQRLEQAYLATARNDSGQSVMASFDGEIAGRSGSEGRSTVPTVIVNRFVGIWPGQSCERTMARAELTNHYWRIAGLEGQSIRAIPGRREPHLILGSLDGVYRATVGCGEISGKFFEEGGSISFSASEQPLPACPESLLSTQALLTGVLAAARRWSIEGQVLELFGANGESVATFEAVYLR